MKRKGGVREEPLPFCPRSFNAKSTARPPRALGGDGPCVQTRQVSTYI